MSVDGADAWKVHGECRRPGVGHPDLWSPPGFQTAEHKSAARWAARVCFERCPVQEECLLAAVAGTNGVPEPDGVWGGMNPSQRAEWMAARGAEARAEVIERARRQARVLPRQRVKRAV